MKPRAVVVDRLTRTYRSHRSAPEVTALDHVDLTILEGETHGLLGPNGAGKSTLVKILSTMLTPTSGSAEVLGHDVVSKPDFVRASVGVVLGGERGLYTRVSARQNLSFWCALYHLDRKTAKTRCAELLERVGLADRADEPVERFSRGMKQRLHLARGLLHDPRIVFLDEPTSGMDPGAAHDFRNLVRALQREGRTVLLATHDMAEAEALCDRVSLIDHGKLLLSEPTAQVGQVLGVSECVDFTCEDDALVKELAELPVVTDVAAGESRNTWRAFPSSTSETRKVLSWLIDRDVLSARRTTPSLEEVYLRLVGTRGMRV